MQYTLGFIGCGNMGGALVAAAAKSLQAGEIAVCDYDGDKVARMQKEYGALPATIEEVAKNARFVVLGVKPQAMEQTLSPIAEILRNRTDVTVVTMAAGVSVAGLLTMLGGKLPVIRIMPNTPVAVGTGMVLYANVGASKEQEEKFLQCFAQAGKLDKIEESAIDAGSALSGCGPAFVYAFAEGLIKGAVACGVPEDKANLYAAQTLQGAAKMLQTFGNPSALKKAVCSPNGTTLAGVGVLDERGFEETVVAAVQASYKRTLELKK